MAQNQIAACHLLPLVLSVGLARVSVTLVLSKEKERKKEGNSVGEACWNPLMVWNTQTTGRDQAASPVEGSAEQGEARTLGGRHICPRGAVVAQATFISQPLDCPPLSAPFHLLLLFPCNTAETASPILLPLPCRVPFPLAHATWSLQHPDCSCWGPQGVGCPDSALKDSCRVRLLSFPLGVLWTFPKSAPPS